MIILSFVGIQFKHTEERRLSKDGNSVLQLCFVHKFKKKVNSTLNENYEATLNYEE